MSPHLYTTAIFDEGIVCVPRQCFLQHTAGRRRDLVWALGVPAICLTGFVLLASACMTWRPASRAHLNRVSFRRLVSALLANPVRRLQFSGFSNSHKPPVLCWDLLLALNFQSVLVHGVNGQMMEKYYILGASLLSLVCGVTPYAAAGKLGWNAVNETCWFRN
ncbi:hypothetical protein DFH07DRAFT_798722 [Mycena maculata]|uniref:Uncharacterized protein n=1 Tax=Mycena maculata TaxID=230809 RepID=A0AAD7K6H0_9AGAR|nr:hypothetical protein DFH07DRAFT_798722 [Mycena maculata]